MGYLGSCYYCGEKLDETSRVNTRFCSDDHRVKFHNDTRRVENLYKKARRAIEELRQYQGRSETMRDTLLAGDANAYLRRLIHDITDDNAYSAISCEKDKKPSGELGGRSKTDESLP